VITATILAVALQGWASQYAPGVMDTVVLQRQAWGQLPADLSGYDGFVARPLAEEIGDTVYLRPAGQTEWEQFLVVDCGCPQGREWMLSNDILVEVDYETAVRWDTVGRGLRVAMLTEVAWRETMRSEGELCPI